MLELTVAGAVVAGVLSLIVIILAIVLVLRVKGYLKLRDGDGKGVASLCGPGPCAAVVGPAQCPSVSPVTSLFFPHALGGQSFLSPSG